MGNSSGMLQDIRNAESYSNSTIQYDIDSILLQKTIPSLKSGPVVFKSNIVLNISTVSNSVIISPLVQIGKHTAASDIDLANSS